MQSVILRHNLAYSACAQCFLPLLMFCFEATPPSSTSYNCRHYPAGRIHGDHCSFPQLLANIINNRSPSLSLHLCCLHPPLHLSLGCTVGSDYCRSIVEEREEGERQRWSGGVHFPPWDMGIAKKPAFMTITSRAGHKNTQTQTYLNPWGFTHKHIMTCHATEYIYSSTTAHNTVSLPLYSFSFDSHFDLALCYHCNWLSRVQWNELLEFQNCVDVNKIRMKFNWKCFRCDSLIIRQVTLP